MTTAPGTFASALEPLARAGADLQVVMAYRYPGSDKGAVDLHPVSGRKSREAAQTAGLAPSTIPVLLVEGDDRPGLGYTLAKAVGDAGINMSFVMAQTEAADTPPCSASRMRLTRPRPRL